MRLGLLLLAVCCFSATGATTSVPSMSRADAVSYIAAASAGDTLVFPSGSADWASGVTINKALTLDYVEGESFIRNTSGGQNTFIYTVDTSGADDAVRISGLTIHVTSTAAQGAGSGIFVDNDQKNVRIDNCHFGNLGRHGIQFAGFESFGLIDHCTFTNNYTAIEVNGGDASTWTFTTLAQYGLGTTNCVVVEDCYFENNDDSLVTELNNVIYVSNGGKIDMRNCQVEGIGTEQNTVFWDSHGNNSQDDPLGSQNWAGDALRGTVFAVISNVTINVDASYRHFYLRGGMHVLIDVDMTGPGGAAPISLTEEEAWATFSFDLTDDTWPAADAITNTWIKNVTHNGVAINEAKIIEFFGDSNAVDEELEDADETFIQLNRDCFITSGSIPALGQNHPTISGGLYGVNWLTYPHPRVTAEDGGGEESGTPSFSSRGTTGARGSFSVRTQ